MAEEAKLKTRLEVAGTEEAKRKMKSATQSMVADAQSVKAAYFAVAGAVGGVVAASLDAVKAFSQHETIMTRLKQAGVDNVRATDAWSTSIQRATGTSSDLVANLTALGLSFGATEEMARKMTVAALDMEAQGLLSADSGVRNLGKSLTGMAGELGEVLAGVKDLTPEMLKAGGAIELAAKQFGGAAEAQGQTLTGAMTRAKEAAHDLKVEYGQMLAVIVGQAGSGLSGGGSREDALSFFDRLVDKVNALGVAVDRTGLIGRITSGSLFSGYMNHLFNGGVIAADPQADLVRQGAFGPMYGPERPPVGSSSPVPVVITNASGGVMGDINAELGLYGRVGPGAFLPGARTGSSVPGYGPGVDAFIKPPLIDNLDNGLNKSNMLAEQLSGTLARGLSDAIFYAKDFGEALRSIFMNAASDLAAQGIEKGLKLLLLDKPGGGGGGSYDIGPTDNNPQLQSMSREISRQQAKARRRGF